MNRRELSEYMREMGRRGGKKGGKKGGKSRMAQLSPEQRKEFAKKGALTRWSKTKKNKKT